MIMIKRSLGLILFLIIVLSSCRKSDYITPAGPEVIRDNGGGTGTVTWSQENNYLIEGLVFVNDGQELTIKKGTVIRFKTGQGSAASALIVARGGKIIAEGTESEPIILTAETDDLNGSVPVDATGLWGGLIILGNARINLAAGESHVEGIPIYEPRGVFGGYDDEDNSGILRHISIRHCGTNIGEGNEINGLTLAAVGNNTLVDHIEVISSSDDGIEIFGGTVGLKYISIAFCGDDALDFDLGFRGKLQFISVIQYFSRGDKIIEIDGGSDPVAGKPYTEPVIFNGTFIGRGQADQERTIAFGRNGGGVICNSIFLNQRHGIEVEYVEGAESSYQQFVNGRLSLKGNIFHQIEGNNPDSIFTVTAAEGTDISQYHLLFSAHFAAAGNVFSDPGIEIHSDFFDVLPAGNVYENLVPVSDPWFDETSFKGAFYTYSWIEGWTLLSQAGFVP